MKAKTSFATRTNPFTGQPAIQHHDKTRMPNIPVNLELLTICNDPIPTHRAQTEGKYDALLKSLKPGQCIKCPTTDVERIGNAIRKHIERHHPTCMLRSMRDYGDGMGRVWMLPRPEKLNPKA